MHSGYLTGERLFLREVRPSDVTERYYGWMTDPEVYQFLESRFLPISQELLRDYVTSKLGDRNNAFFAIVTRQDDQHIGNIKLGPIDWVHRTADIGLLIGDRACWGKGYATEAIGLVVRYAFDLLNLRRLTAGCYDENVGSAKAFEKCGFQVEGRLRQHRFSRGAYSDVLLLGLVRGEDRDPAGLQIIEGVSTAS